MAVFVFVFLIFWKFFILWLLTIQELPSNVPAPIFLDKIIHFSLFGVLSFLIFVFFYLTNNGKFESIMIAFFWSSFYAIFCEYIQSFLPYRNASFFDFLAGMLGAMIILAAAFVKGGIWEHKDKRNPRLLLHICCAGCGVYVSSLLQKNYKIVLYYYNPNMHPKAEYKKRLKEVVRVAKKYKLELILGPHSHDKWLEKIRGMENEPERGIRCEACFRDRLEKTVQVAKKRNFDFFTTTLTVSPHKNFDIIKNIGFDMEKKYGVRFLCQDFKKDGGFQKSIKLSKELDLYRQNYCGCEFSRQVGKPKMKSL